MNFLSKYIVPVAYGAAVLFLGAVIIHDAHAGPNAGPGQQVQGFGKAGTPLGGILTVQGDAAGTPIPVTLGALSSDVNVAKIGGNTVTVLAAGEQKNGVEGLAASGVAVSGNPVRTGGNNGGVTRDFAVDGVGDALIMGTVSNDTSAIAAGLEVQPAVSRATPTATTAGRSEKLQVGTANGALFGSIVGGVGTTVADVTANDGVALGNGLQVQAAISKTAPATTTAGRSEALQMGAASGGLFVAHVATTTATAPTGGNLTAATATSVYAGASGICQVGVSNLSSTIAMTCGQTNAVSLTVGLYVGPLQTYTSSYGYGGAVFCFPASGTPAYSTQVTACPQ